MMRQEGFLRVKEAARMLGVSPNTVRAWGADGKIPEYRHPVNRYDEPYADQRNGEGS